uniref:Uncharacterized protein n=1 Tax=Sciurus vulgaris TaxID=55149 RepID=A0A8D2JNW9_SCIVU
MSHIPSHFYFYFLILRHVLTKLLRAFRAFLSSSRAAGITGVHHCAWPHLVSSW